VAAKSQQTYKYGIFSVDGNLQRASRGARVGFRHLQLAVPASAALVERIGMGSCTPHGPLGRFPKAN